MSTTSGNHQKLIFLIFSILLLIGALYITFRYSLLQSNNIILPGGVTYLGPSSTTKPIPPTLTVKPRKVFTAPSDDKWVIFHGSIYPYSLNHPQSLNLVVFPKDKSDSVAFSFDNIDPRVNILLNIEKISDRDPRLSGKPIIDYVKNWYKYFSGLKGVDKIDAFQNVNNLKGYRAVFINDVNQTPNVDVFLEIPGSNDLVIHLANGNLDPSIFDRIVDSVNWTPKK